MFLDFIQQYPFILSFIVGLVPALVWLWFWLKEDIHPEPAKMVTLSFIGGMIAVLFVLPFQKIVYHYFQHSEAISFTLWATIEELSKFGFVYFIALQNKKLTDEPIDDIIYLIISALGFVTFENALFLHQPINEGNLIDTIIHGNLRFVGASLLHIMTSATIGIMMALSFYKTSVKRKLYTIIGIIVAIALHTAFNLFIISEAPGNIFFIFGTVWIGIIVLLLVLEKVKHLQNLQAH